MADFNPRSPCGERPEESKRIACSHPYFNPRSPCGERLAISIRDNVKHDFNPRSPCGERLISQSGLVMLVLFQSTLPVWGATEGMLAILTAKKISIHAPSVGSDVIPIPGRRDIVTFQSTLPVWGATRQNDY